MLDSDIPHRNNLFFPLSVASTKYKSAKQYILKEPTEMYVRTGEDSHMVLDKIIIQSTHRFAMHTTFYARYGM